MVLNLTATPIRDKEFVARKVRTPRYTANAGKFANKSLFNLENFFELSGVATQVCEFSTGESLFSQGDPASSVMYLQQGAVKFSVVNEAGKEAVVAVFRPGDFFGEDCLAERPVRMASAAAIAPTTALVISKTEMVRALRAGHGLSDFFISYMLARKIRVEEDLVDQIFNKTEKRLARTLLLLAAREKPDHPEGVLPKVTQETLAAMIGTTRSRVNVFLNRFRKRGLIESNGNTRINIALLTRVLSE